MIYVQCQCSVQEVACSIFREADRKGVEVGVVDKRAAHSTCVLCFVTDLQSMVAFFLTVATIFY